MAQKIKKSLNRYLNTRYLNAISSIGLNLTASKSRYLTDGEIILARSVFGEDINLDKVALKTAWWVLKNYAVSPNGNIYFSAADWIEDFAQTTLSKQSWLIHELTHVWQLQQGIKVVRGAVFDRRYRYIIKTGKSFFRYGIEQQARMVQDYFIRRQRGQDCQDLQACIPFLRVQSDNPIKDTDSPFTV
ncbi:type IV secretion protein Rhs [Psychrobacter sp. DM4]|uniref:type IV secretion protein Rhs n=1 Tax=Psychrobacter sp. DM4 TaxID=3440637 RepID=UPI003F502A44